MGIPSGMHIVQDTKQLVTEADGERPLSPTVRISVPARIVEPKTCLKSAFSSTPDRPHRLIGRNRNLICSSVDKVRYPKFSVVDLSVYWGKILQQLRCPKHRVGKLKKVRHLYDSREKDESEREKC